MMNDFSTLTADDLWKRMQPHLIAVLSELTFMNHFGLESRGVSIENNTLLVELTEDKDGESLLRTFASLFDVALRAENAPAGMKLKFVSPQPVAPVIPQKAPNFASNGAPKVDTLQPDMTFDSFVEGPSNQFPVTMARYVAMKPGDDVNRTNPLFLYGPTGVGKTHLMHAIGNMAKKLNPNLSILYTTSDNLLNEYVRSWTSDENKNTFRQKFRSVDILLVDDIQLMAGKKGFMDEFFNIFNALKDNHRQIVMTSDRAPKEITDLMDRLVSRFESGICADVDMPAYETRLNILLMKLRSYPGINLNREVLDFIAQKVTSSVRALEGALSSTIGYARMFPNNMAEAVTVEVLQKSVLKNFIAQEESIVKLSSADIQKAVCDHYDISLADLHGKSREQRIAVPRQVAIYLSRKLTDSSTTEVGNTFKRTHATVVYASKAINDLYKQGDQKTVKALKEIVTALGRSLSDLN